MAASEKGHTEAIKALLTAPGIDVNHVDVSLCLLTPPIYLIHICLILSLTLTLALTTHHSFYSPLSVSLQRMVYTALICASETGHAEAIKILLTAPGINVNQATKVNIYTY